MTAHRFLVHETSPSDASCTENQSGLGAHHFLVHRTSFSDASCTKNGSGARR